MRDGFQIRRAAVENRVPCFTSLDTARAAVRALLVASQTMPAGRQAYTVQPLRQYLRRDGSRKDLPRA
jgi:carbamoyl-phosphate synthase large subunit